MELALGTAEPVGRRRAQPSVWAQAGQGAEHPRNVSVQTTPRCAWHLCNHRVRWTVCHARPHSYCAPHLSAHLHSVPRGCSVAPAVETYYGFGTDRAGTKVARQLAQQWVDVEEASLHRKAAQPGGVVDIPNLPALRAAATRRGTGLRLRDVPERELAEQRAYYGQAESATPQVRPRSSRGGGDRSSAGAAGTSGAAAARSEVQENVAEPAPAVPRIVVVGTSQQKTRHRRRTASE